MTRVPLVVITGPTGSGKTALAIKVAQQYDGEIICADSRTIYKEMDIGTAKPSLKEQALIRHWGLDLVEPGERFTASDFKGYTIDKIKDIRMRGKVPIIAGGTGLYIDSIIFDYSFAGAADMSLRQELNKMSLDELCAYCNLHNIILPENDQNKRYVARAIERQSASVMKKSGPPPATIIVGIATNMNTLRDRLNTRSEQLFTNGVVEEAKMLGKKYGWRSEAMTGNIYPLIKQYVEGKLTTSEVKHLFVTSDYQLAKRQMTWLRRNPYLMWVRLEEAEEFLDGAIRS